MTGGAARSRARSRGSGTAGQPAGRSPLARLLVPASIAFVGLSDNSHFCRTVQPTFASDAEIFMVNPRHDTVLGRPTVPSLTDLGRPVDAVLSCMSAERST